MNNLRSSEEFVVGKHCIGYISDDFKKYFGTREFSESTMPTFRTLEKRMSDASIESELTPRISTLGDILAFMNNASEECKDGYANIFYFPECVVRVFWHSSDGEWFVIAWDRGEFDWLAGSRVFSPATSIIAKESDTSASVLESDLIQILMRHCGERGNNEGTVETLERIIRERDILLKNVINKDVFKLI